ncbi:glycosyltransferase [Priestia megaterium]|uniref:glycosyltransferase n=1 Tax=Priestia megaterium TaxID=1404 RepID=UPI00366F080A
MKSTQLKPKILIVHNYYQIPGGEDTVVENEKKMLEDHGHEVIVYSRNNSELQKMSKFQKLGLPFSTVFSIRTYREVKRIIKQQNIDIVHVHNTLNLISPSVYYAAFSCKVKVIQTVHNFRLVCPGALLYRDGNICEDCIHKGLRCAIFNNCYRDSKLQTLACVITLKTHRFLGTYKNINYICLTEFNKEKLLEVNRGGKKIIDPKKVFVKPNFTSLN